MAILSKTDFTGRYRIALAQGDTEDDFNANLEEVQQRILRGLLGDYLYSAFIADLVSGVPQTQKYVDLLNGKTYTDDCGYQTVYEGLKPILKATSYHEWLKISSARVTVNGAGYSLSENMDYNTKRQNTERNFEHVWNEGLKQYYQAVKYIYNEEETYFPDPYQDEFERWMSTYDKLTPYNTSLTVTPSNKYYYNKLFGYTVCSNC